MLLDFGNTEVDEKWFVNETSPIGFCRVYRIRSGIVRYRGGDDDMRLLPGRTYVLPSAAPYSVSRELTEPFRCTYLHIEPSPRIVDRIFSLDDDTNSLAASFINTISEAIAAGKTELVRRISPLLMLLWDDRSEVKLVSEKVEAAINYIDCHLNEKIGAEALGAIVGYHPNYFIGLFRRETGVSPHQYIINRRLQKAITLLESGLSVAEAAEAVGFERSDGLSRAFKARFGTTPCSYKSCIKP